MSGIFSGIVYSLVLINLICKAVVRQKSNTKLWVFLLTFSIESKVLRDNFISLFSEIMFPATSHLASSLKGNTLS